MNKYYVVLMVLLIALKSFSQTTSGKVTNFTIKAQTLRNDGGENPNRDVSVYLPPGYENGNKRFPVIYYLQALCSDTHFKLALEFT